MRDAGPAERSLPRSRRRGNARKPPTATIAEDWSVRDRLQKKGAKKRSLERRGFNESSSPRAEGSLSISEEAEPSAPSVRSKGKGIAAGGARGLACAPCAPHFLPTH